MRNCVLEFYLSEQDVAESVECRLPIRKVGSWIPGQVKISDLRSLYLSLANLMLSITRIGQGLVAQYQDNVTEW